LRWDHQVVFLVVLPLLGLLFEPCQRNAFEEKLFSHLVESSSDVDGGGVNE